MSIKITREAALKKKIIQTTKHTLRLEDKFWGKYLTACI